MQNNFWHNKKVLITGHTGFKGSWLSIWLTELGAKVTGYALQPPTDPSIYQICKLDKKVNSIIADVRDLNLLTKAVSDNEIVIHMAAQPLVRDSYTNPVETYQINVMGTVNVLEAVRLSKSVKAVVNVTTDKCYDNKEWVWGYRENDPFGGFDPYSNSKGCSELVTSAYRNSFKLPLASARAGNVIGGGDWAKDRLVPDFIRAIMNKEIIKIRYPRAIRPWQHVLEPLSGYIMLAQKVYTDCSNFAEGWNFGPNDSDVKDVEWIVSNLCNKWGLKSGYEIDKSGNHPHEANLLKLDCSKARAKLGWNPKWDSNKALDKIVEWTKSYIKEENMYNICKKQIEEYQND